MIRLVLIIISLHLVTLLSAQYGHDDSDNYLEVHRGPRKLIIFEDTVKWKHYIIREHDFIRYRLIGSPATLKGKILKINRDSMFLQHGCLLLGEIDKISNSHSKSPRFHVQHSRSHLLPDSMSHHHGSIHDWKHSIHKKMKTHRVLAGSDTIHENFLKLNLSRLLRLEIAFSYERKLKSSLSLEFEAGYGFPVYDRTTPGNGDIFETFEYFPSEGFSLLAGPKFYRIKKNRPGYYLGPQVIVKALRYLNTYFPSDHSEDPNSEFYPFGDKYTMVYGIALRIGTVRKYGNVILDYYGGVGIQLKSLTYHYYGYYNHYDGETIYYTEPHIQKQNQLWPVINLGVKMGFGF